MNIKQLKNATWQQLKQLVKQPVSPSPIVEKQHKTVEVEQPTATPAVKAKTVKKATESTDIEQ